MSQLKRRALLLALVAALLVPTFQGRATSVIQMNLEQLCTKSDQIFRGTVLDMTESTVEVGGGALPAVTYTVRVDEAFQGQFDTEKGVPLARFTTLGTKKQHLSGQMPIPGLPRLAIGGEYLLMVAPSGPTGLTTTMGLGQGCFTIAGKPGAETAVNELGNRGLFAGMTVSGVTTASGDVSYPALAALINSILGEGN